MSVQVNSIQRRHIDRNFYVLDRHDHLINTSKEQAENPLQTAHRLLELSQNEGNSERQRKILVSCAYDYLHSIEGHHSINTTEKRAEWLDCKTDCFLLLLGKAPSNQARESLSPFIADPNRWMAFLMKNHIHYMVQRQGIDFAPGMDDVIDQICVSGKWIRFSQLECKEADGEITYTYNGEIAFVTDKEHKLKGYFWAGDNGIIQGSSMDKASVGQFFQREPSGKHWLSVYCVAKDEMDVKFGRSHSYLSLEDDEGKVSYAGQYGAASDLTWFDYVQPLKSVPVGIETPDRYTSVPLSHWEVREQKIEITKDQYDRLMNSLKKDKEKGRAGSLISGNCTTYVAKKLKMIGVQARTEMTVHEYLGRRVLSVLPRSLEKRVVQWVSSLPETTKKVCMFCPFVYLPILALFGAVTLLGCTSKNITLFNVLFRPWKFTIDHPLVFFDWLDKAKEDLRDHKIYKAQVVDQSEIGQAITSTAAGMGFQNDSEGRIKTTTAKHITQYIPESLPVMVIMTLFRAIKLKLENWFNRRKLIDHNTMLLYLHSLKNQRFITPYQYRALQDSMHDDKLFRMEIGSVIRRLSEEKKIDRRSHIHLMGLLKAHKMQEALSYVMALSLLNNMNTAGHHETMRKVMTPRVQMDIEKYLKEYHTTYSFSREGISAIQSLSARINCYEWAEKISDKEISEEIKRAVVERNEKAFYGAMKKHLDKLQASPAIASLDSKIIVEMQEAIKYPGDNAFVHFSHILETQRVLNNLEQDMDQLQEQLKAHRHKISPQITEDLKQLHQNIGITLSSDQGYTGSATLFCRHLGSLRRKWEQIEDLLTSVPGVSSRLIPLADQTDTWPDLGFREIKPLYFEPTKVAQDQDVVPKKKVFFAYCSMGNGHRSVTDALQRYIGDQYRVTCCDVPDEILIERDPVFNLLGKGQSITTLYNTLVAGNYWDVLELIQKMGEKPTPEEESLIQKDMIKRKLLQERPDVVVVTYERNARIHQQAAQELGIPFVMYYPDMVSNTSTIFSQDRHSKLVIPVDLPEMRQSLKNTASPEQISVGGYAVRPEFFEEMNKEELKTKYGIAEGQKVILCANGGIGSDTPWPQLIARTKKGELGSCKVIVVCGKNEAFYQEIKDLEAIDPAVKIEVLGLVDARKMAELTEIADVVISKPGGATTAENILKKNYLLLDARFVDKLPWELNNAEIIERFGFGSSVKSTGNFIEKLKQGLQTDVKDHPTFHNIDPRKKFTDLIGNMIKEAEADPECCDKRRQADLAFTDYPTIDVPKERWKHFEQNLAEILNLNDTLYPKEVMPSLETAILQGAFLKFNFEKKEFESSNEFLSKDIHFALNVLKIRAKGGESISLKALSRFTDMVIQGNEKYPGDVKEIMEELSSLDRARVSKMMKQVNVPATLKDAMKFYRVPGAREHLEKWVHLTTSKSRIKGTDERMLSEAEAIQVFMQNPEEYDFVKNLYLHRKASAFSHKFSVEDGHLCVRYNGVQTPVPNLLGKFRYLNDRIISTENNHEYTYTFDNGLSPIEEGENPIAWEEEIPILKKKASRKHSNYCLEVISAIGKHSHSWIRLKDPEGNVHSLGRVWDPDYQLENIQMMTTIPGVVKAGDDHEFLGMENDWKTTKIVLDESDYQKIKKKIIQINKEDKTYNLANNNCITFVKDVLDEIGMHYRTDASAVTIYGPIPKVVKKFFVRHETIRKIADVIGYPFTLIEKALLVILGMFKNRDVSPEQVKSGYKSFWTVLNSNTPLIDYYTQLRLVQEVIEEDYGSADGKVYWSQYRQTLKTRAVADGLGQSSPAA